MMLFIFMYNYIYLFTILLSYISIMIPLSDNVKRTWWITIKRFLLCMQNKMYNIHIKKHSCNGKLWAKREFTTASAHIGTSSLSWGCWRISGQTPQRRRWVIGSLINREADTLSASLADDRAALHREHKTTAALSAQRQAALHPIRPDIYDCGR